MRIDDEAVLIILIILSGAIIAAAIGTGLGYVFHTLYPL